MSEIISEEIANEQFDLLVDYYDIDKDSIEEVWETIKKKLIKAIREGKVEIKNGDELQVIQTIKDGTEYIYHELNGKAKVQMDRFEGRHEKIYALLGMLSKKPKERIQDFKGRDLTIAEYIGVLFLAA